MSWLSRKIHAVEWRIVRAIMRKWRRNMWSGSMPTNSQIRAIFARQWGPNGPEWHDLDQCGAGVPVSALWPGSEAYDLAMELFSSRYVGFAPRLIKAVWEPQRVTYYMADGRMYHATARGDSIEWEQERV